MQICSMKFTLEMEASNSLNRVLVIGLSVALKFIKVTHLTKCSKCFKKFYHGRADFFQYYDNMSSLLIYIQIICVVCVYIT